MTISEIIKAAGGPSAIVAASKDNGKKITVWAVHRWRRRGIPDEHWAVIMRLSGDAVTESKLFAANEALRRAFPKYRAQYQPAA